MQVISILNKDYLQKKCAIKVSQINIALPAIFDIEISRKNSIQLCEFLKLKKTVLLNKWGLGIP